MTNVVVHLSCAASRYSQLAQGTGYALDECLMPSSRTSGSRGAISHFVAGELVYKCKDSARDAIDRFDWNAVSRNATILRLPETVLRLTLVAAATVSAVLVLSSAVLA